MKSDQYDKNNFKSFYTNKPNPPNVFKKSLRERYDDKSRLRESLSREKKSTDSLQRNSLEKRKSLNNNISINVYINNTKIETPTRNKGKKSNIKFDK